MKPYRSTKSHNGGIKRRSSIVSRFLTTSFSAVNVTWIHQEAWEESCLPELSPFFAAPPLGINHRQSYVYENKRDNLVFPIGSWGLKVKGAPQYVGLASATALFRGFVHVHLHMSVTENEGLCSQDLWIESVRLLVSALFIGAECDLIRIIPRALSPRDLQPATWAGLLKGSSNQQIWTPMSQGARLALSMIHHHADSNSMQSFSGQLLSNLIIDPQNWWQSEIGKNHLSTLHYLSARKTSERDRAKGLQKKQRRNRWAKFLRW